MPSIGARARLTGLMLKLEGIADGLDKVADKCDDLEDAAYWLAKAQGVKLAIGHVKDALRQELEEE